MLNASDSFFNELDTKREPCSISSISFLISLTQEKNYASETVLFFNELDIGNEP